jgi:hypothetical protein
MNNRIDFEIRKLDPQTRGYQVVLTKNGRVEGWKIGMPKQRNHLNQYISSSTAAIIELLDGRRMEGWKIEPLSNCVSCQGLTGLEA